MIAYLLRRLFGTVPVVALVLLIVFGLTRLIPGDPAVTLLGPGASTEQVERLRHQLRLDRPAPAQLLAYTGGLAHGDLGTSLKTGRPVRTALAAKLPATLELAAAAFLLALAIGIPTGIAAGIRPNGTFDTASRIVALAGVSLPAFLTALGLQWLFGVWLGWLPIAARQDPAATTPSLTGFLFIDAVIRRDAVAFSDAARHVMLPALVLASFLAATLSRFVRNTMVATLDQPYIRAARARGVAARAVTWQHAVPNAILPVLPIVGIQFGDMLGGAILTETVFSWPGIGRYMVEAIRNRDYAVIQSTTLVFAILFLGMSILVDAVSIRLDPRGRPAG